jgi:type IV secretory pathway VirB6-like protein
MSLKLEEVAVVSTQILYKIRDAFNILQKNFCHQDASVWLKLLLYFIFTLRALKDSYTLHSSK